MLKLKVAALSVNNLTDARYFAAYMVDWIGFNINPASADYIDREKLSEILGWVEGPQYLLQGVEWNEAATEIIEHADAKIAAVLLETDTNAYGDLQIFCKDADRLGDYQIFADLSAYHAAEIDPTFAYIQYQGDIQLVHDLLSMPDPPGLSLSGGDEQAVGLKAYDELDEVFDLLYD